MKEERDSDEESKGAGQDCPADVEFSGGCEDGSAGEHGLAPASVCGVPPSPQGYGAASPPPPNVGTASVTEEEKAAIQMFLEGKGPQQPTAQMRAIIWALKWVATLLLMTGVGAAVGDGNEYDGVDCGVAAKPPNFSKGPSGRASADRASSQQPLSGQPPGPSGPSGLPPGACGSSLPFGLGAVLADLPLHCFGVLAEHLAVGPSAVLKAVEAAMQRFEGKLDAVARGNFELLKENGELRALHKDGFFKFALKVEAEDFRAFATIMALGNRRVAAEVLKVPARTFYDRVRKWNLRGVEYQRIARLIGWRKCSARRIKVRLEDSVQSGQPNDEAENPVTVAAVLESIATADTQDYPAILRQVMETLEAQNVKNWPAVRDELVEMIKEEVPQ